MNRDCKGDWFPTLGKYRCLGDGSWDEYKTLPVECSNCNRPIDAQIHKEATTRQLLVTEVFIEPIGWIEMEHEEIEEAA
jgi:hypothetical protein